MNKKYTVIGLCFFVIASTHSAQPPVKPAQTKDECKARANRARRECEIAYFSQCMIKKENDEKCAAKKIDRDCYDVYQEVYEKEIKAMIQENLNAPKK